ncbi:MAG TPA: SxtJ family membrane protein [Candidatus Glassbacteria bacterium]|nr:SxtJ family membrane protein [Candidatus Glassbacteria bacterium]
MEKKKQESRADYRKFGLSVGTAFLVLAGVLYWRNFPNGWRVAAALGGFLLLSGLSVPGLLKWPFRLWMKMAAGLGWFNTRLILTLAFYLVIAPMGFLLVLLGKRPLPTGFDREAKSYWIKREHKPFDPARCEKHF